MSREELCSALNEIEDYISFYEHYSIFGVYILINKTELYNKFKLLYNLLPQELIDKRDWLCSQKEENIFSILNKINFIIEHSKVFLGLIFINLNTIRDYIDKIYVILPEDIKICLENKGTILNNIETIEIPNFLKK